MTDTFSALCHSREQAHEAAQQAYLHAQSVISNGKPAVLSVAEFDNDRSLQQNKYYWGACLAEISAQARINGQRYTVDAWHELFRRQFLGYEIVRVSVAGRKKPTIIRRLRSTRKLPVGKFAKYLDELQAFATTDLAVVFSGPPP